MENSITWLDFKEWKALKEFYARKESELHKHWLNIKYGK